MLDSVAGSITIERIRRAAERIHPHVHRTPILTSATLDRALDMQIFFKAEHMQKVGAFKVRGATNAVFALDDATARRGVGTHSSGNHAAALAYAASRRRINCTVVMPDSAPSIKVEAVRSYGAEIIFCNQMEREATTTQLQKERGFILVHPYEDPDVIAGQGTTALELLASVPELDAVVAPVGGGGLLAGITVTAQALRPSIHCYGAEPEAVDDAFRSLESGVRQPQVRDPETVCDGLLTSLGKPNFEILQRGLVEILRVDEETILRAASALLQRMKQVVEPSAAVGLATLAKNRIKFRRQRVGVVLSGGNTDLQWLNRAATLPSLVE